MRQAVQVEFLRGLSSTIGGPILALRVDRTLTLLAPNHTATKSAQLGPPGCACKSASLYVYLIARRMAIGARPLSKHSSVGAMSSMHFKRSYLVLCNATNGQHTVLCDEGVKMKAAGLLSYMRKNAPANALGDD
eukprot:6211416-Pleurochrysis_carterae.AAC.1